MSNYRDYEKQAVDMLAGMGATMTAKYIRNGLYFFDDKQERDVYRITVKRAGRSWSFLFGQSIAHSDGETAPTCYDVLAGLTKYNVGTFDNFCDDFGYDNDSRKIKKVYKAVVREYASLCRLFTLAEIEKMQEVQ